MKWTYITNNYHTVSLHDMVVDSTVLVDNNFILKFSDGFAVTKENELNTTGKHMHTSQACMILYGAAFISATDLHLEEKIVPDNLFKENVTLLKTSFENNKMTTLFLNEKANFCEATLSYTNVEFCWNSYQTTAWF